MPRTVQANPGESAAIARGHVGVAGDHGRELPRGCYIRSQSPPKAADGARSWRLKPRFLETDDFRVELAYRGDDVLWLAEEPKAPAEIEARDSDLVDAMAPTVAD